MLTLHEYFTQVLLVGNHWLAMHHPLRPLRESSMRPAHFLASVVTAAAAVIALANPASAAPVNYVALGDSYASGLGTGSYDGASGSCKRGPLAYPALWAAATAPTSFKSVACSGAKTG